jgi:DNA sulfur modification protein DndB
MKYFKELSLPCLRGSIGNWVYYCTVIPFKELARIDNTHRIKEDKNLDNWLQRALNERVEGIKTYLLNEDERFFNSVIVGLYGEIPDWYSLDLTAIEEKFKINISEEVRESLGVLTLSGKEVLFTIDGQHRIEAVKRARVIDAERFKSDELSVIFVGHSDDEKGYVRTRKLFATINREAKQPTQNDLAIMDETYAYNIVARMIFARYDKFKDKIALTDNYDLDRNEHTHFTNLLNLVEVNKKLFKAAKYKESKYNSPTYETREELFSVACDFYNFITTYVVEYKEYFDNEKKLSEYRNAAPNKPLNLLFLPVGINLICEIYCHFKIANKLNELKGLINDLDFNLYEGHFKFIYFNPVQNKIVTTNKTLGKKLALYLMGEKLNISDIELKKGLAKAYSINELSDDYMSFSLPAKIRQS